MKASLLYHSAASALIITTETLRASGRDFKSESKTFRRACGGWTGKRGFFGRYTREQTYQTHLSESRTGSGFWGQRSFDRCERLNSYIRLKVRLDRSPTTRVRSAGDSPEREQGAARFQSSETTDGSGSSAGSDPCIRAPFFNIPPKPRQVYRQASEKTILALIFRVSPNWVKTIGKLAKTIENYRKTG